MKRFKRHGGVAVLVIFCWLPSARGQSSLDRIAKIVITNVGPSAVSQDFVRANIHVKVGDVYVRPSVDEDVKNLYATGFFNNIEVLDNLSDNGVVLTYILRGKLKLTNVKFEGNVRYSNSRLLKKLTSKIGEPVDERKLFNDCQEIQKMYEKAGYPHTTVTYVYNNFDENAGRSGVTFEIKEAVRVKIMEVDFVGAHAYSQRKLRHVIKTRAHWWLSWLTRSGIFKDDQFEDDKDKLIDYYRSNGYIDFELQDVRLIYPTPKTLRIEFVVNEGSLYKVGAVNFTGTNQLFSTDELIRGLKLQHDYSHSKTNIGPHGLEADVGFTFKPQALDHDVQAIEDFYGARGYIDVKEGPNLRVTRIPNTESGTIDIGYEITAGQKSYIEKIEIKGNVKTKDRVIRRELAVSPGEVFDMVRVRVSKQRLEGLQYFDKVDTKVENTVVPNRKDLIVGVDEKSTGQFSFGAGFNTVDSIVGFAEVSQSNFDLFKPPYFTGGGQKVRLRIQLGTLRQDYTASFVEPWFLGRKLQLGIDAFRSVYDFQSLDNLYNETHTGGRVSLTRALGSDFLIGSVSYTIEDVGIVDVLPNSPVTIQQDAGHTLLHRFGTSLAYDTRNGVELPNKGQRTELDVQYVTGDRTYYKMEGKSAWYFKGLAKGHVLELVGKIGVAERLSGGDIPFFDRYYLGGQYSLRGYDYRAVGPRDVTLDGQSYEPIGGDTYWLASAEYSVPIIDRLRFAVFYDIGNVSSRPYYFGSTPVQGLANNSTPGIFGSPLGSPNGVYLPYLAGNTGSYSDDYGFGIRLNLPIGPLRLDYGIPIHHDNFSSGGGKFQFGVGFTRPF